MYITLSETTEFLTLGGRKALKACKLVPLYQVSFSWFLKCQVKVACKGKKNERLSFLHALSSEQQNSATSCCFVKSFACFAKLQGP